MAEKIGGMFGDRRPSLPMYKDKPNNSPGKRKGTNGNKAGLVVLLLVGMLWLTGMIPIPGQASSSWSETKKWASRREAVRQAFITSWDHYAEHAWGMDEFHPVSQTSKNLGCATQHDGCPPTGWIIVDALDTAMMMNLTTRVAKARESKRPL